LSSVRHEKGDTAPLAGVQLTVIWV